MFAQSVTSPSECRSSFARKPSQRSMCVECTGGGGTWEKSSSAGSWGCALPKGVDRIGQFRRSKSVKRDEGPKKPSSVGAHFAKYVAVPAGTFQIGSDGEDVDRKSNEYVAQVKLTRGFSMKATEVTQGEWFFITGKPNDFYDAECGYDCAAVGMNFFQALEYLNALSKREKLEPCYEIDGDKASWPKGLDCKGYRLPTEAEWEYAARGKSTERRYGELEEVAWYDKNSDNKLKPVAQKKANAYGLFDMLGNAAEWVWDISEYTAFDKEGEVVDPIIGGTTLGDYGVERTVRGGSALDRPYDSRAAFRSQAYPKASLDRIGFRPVRTLP
ncbi:SUMF1/EgtB/PvdO family nonheme iron enzyme [Myxococcus sp. SDU36]|uniref:formylglycine-generating enzyme family protein n=1 Tax=Myxococcus sp. SDU36 TaxID=2831967 RepID=UPI0025431753|nr:SUMF1/EgtB/PvdO family nonheme iron enzyme [Myxococcus sp. SDU36]WIG94301.1 formylglycine-generating enzyme family protein [Myxococcus sp. SDU36]